MISRHLCRIIAVQSLYEWDFWQVNQDQQEVSYICRKNKDPQKQINAFIENNIKNHKLDKSIEGSDKKFIQELVSGAIKYIEKINQLILKYAPEWPLLQIAAVDRNILRLAIYELIFTDTPPKVVIDEAVELGKLFGGFNSSKFINGVLGSLYKDIESYKKSYKRMRKVVNVKKYKGLLKEFSAGGVVFRKFKNQIKILLLLKADKKFVWVLPKGKINPSETFQKAALREVREETGLDDLKIIASLGKADYYYKSYEKRDMLVSKTVYYFLIESKQGKPLPQKEEGFIKAQWFSVSQALKKVIYKGSQKILKKAALLLKYKNKI